MVTDPGCPSNVTCSQCGVGSHIELADLHRADRLFLSAMEDMQLGKLDGMCTWCSILFKFKYGTVFVYGFLAL